MAAFAKRRTLLYFLLFPRGCIEAAGQKVFLLEQKKNRSWPALAFASVRCVHFD